MRRSHPSFLRVERNCDDPLKNVLRTLGLRRLSTHMNEKDTSPPKALSEHARNVGAVYVQNLSQLLRVACKYRHPPDRAKEIVHEAIVRVLKVKDPDGIENLRAYTFETVRNLALDSSRQRQRRRDKDALLRSNARTEAPHPSTDMEYAANLLAQLLQSPNDLSPAQRRVAELLIQELLDSLKTTRAAKTGTGTAHKRMLCKLAEFLSRLKKRTRKKQP